MIWFRALACLALTMAMTGLPDVAGSQGLRGQEKQILNLTKANWIHFRDFDGHQLIYFTHLEVYRCGISDVRYSLNSDALDRTWVLQPCDLQQPNAVTTDRPYISLPPGTASSVSVQVTFEDGSESEIVRKSP